MTTKSKATPSADLDPQDMVIGKWKIPPITLNSAILMEQIDSPFTRPPEIIEGSGEQLKDKKTGAPVVDRNNNPVIDPATVKYVKNIPTVTELARTLYVLINANDPRTLDIIGDPRKFRNAVSDLARKMTMAEMATLTNRLNDLMTAATKAVTESGLEGDGQKKVIGHLS
jgi:hypothetical protein